MFVMVTNISQMLTLNTQINVLLYYPRYILKGNASNNSILMQIILCGQHSG